MYQFVACDYSATGEGRTICLMITRAYPRQHHYKEAPSPPNKWEGVFADGVTGETIALEQFKEKFGEWLAIGAKTYSQEDFLVNFGRFIPDLTKKLVVSDDQPGNLLWYQELHFNFS